MQKWLKGFCVAVLLGGLLSGTGCISYSSDVGYHDYDYYPDLNVYYYSRGQLYYWNENGHWVSGRELPMRYDIRGHSPKPVHVKGEQPWNAPKPE